MSVEHQYTADIHEDDGCLWAEVEDLPGCFATGEDMDDLIANLAEAMGLYMSTPDTRVYVTIRGYTVVDKEERDDHQHLRVLVDA